MAEAVVWVVDVRRWTGSPATFAKLVDLVDEEIRDRILRYHKDAASPKEFDAAAHHDTRCFLFGRLTLRCIGALFLSKRSICDDILGAPDQHAGFLRTTVVEESRRVVIERTPEGKPVILSTHCCANVSHAGSVVAVAADRLRPCGVDVMPIEIVPSPFEAAELCRSDWQRLASDTLVAEFTEAFEPYFTPREWLWIRKHCEGSSEPFAVLTRFYVLWTLKEAYLKAIGVGLDIDLQRLEFCVDGDVGDDFFFDAASSRERISLAVDGAVRRDWHFSVFCFPEANTVGAVAQGAPNTSVETVAPPAPVSLVHVSPETIAACFL